MKIGQVEFTWRAHRQAFAIRIGGEQRVFRFNKKATRKELFAILRSFPSAKLCSTFLKALTQSNMSVKSTQKFARNVKRW